MPHIEAQIQSWLSRLCHASLYPILESERVCPICWESFNLWGQGHDYPVRVRSMNPHSTCQHIWGRYCIERHFRSGGQWSHRCPLCREDWFNLDEEDEGVGEWAVADGIFADLQLLVDDVVEHREIDGYRNWEEQPANDLPTIIIRLPPPPEAVQDHEAPEVVYVHDAPEPTENHVGAGQRDFNGEDQDAIEGNTPRRRVDEDTLSNVGRLNRSIGFLQRMLSELPFENTNEALLQRVAELELAVVRLWSTVEESRSTTNGRGRAAGSW